MKFQENDIVWAKFAEYPPWPARVLSKDSDAGKSKQCGKNLVPVYFFGTYEFGFVPPENVFDFQENFSKYSKSAKTKPFLKAIEDAKTPEKYQTPKFTVYPANFTPDEEENQEKSAKKLKKEKKIEKPTEKKIDEKIEKVAKKEPEKKERPVRDSPAKKQKTAADQEPNEDSPEMKVLINKRVLFQKICYKKDPSINELQKASDILKHFEEMETNYEHLKLTAIGRLIKAVSKLEIPSDTEFALVPRCQKLLEKWRSIIAEHAIAERSTLGQADTKPEELK